MGKISDTSRLLQYQEAAILKTFGCFFQNTQHATTKQLHFSRGKKVSFTQKPVQGCSLQLYLEQPKPGHNPDVLPGVSDYTLDHHQHANNLGGISRELC